MRTFFLYNEKQHGYIPITETFLLYSAPTAAMSSVFFFNHQKDIKYKTTTMIIYDKNEKELVIPNGLGNLQVGGGSCEGVYQQGFDDGYGEGWREGFESGATSTSGTAYQQGYNVGWQDGVSDGKAMVARDAIELSFSGNGSWEKTFFDDIYAKKVVVNVKQELVQSFMIVFNGNQPLQESDIVSAYIDGVFVVDKADVIHNNNSTILVVYGHPISKQNRVSQISFSIPTSVFSQWSELSSTGEMGINGTRTSGGGYEGGIGVTPIGLSSTADGNNTKITITLI